MDIKNNLNEKCQLCHHLEPTINMHTSYADCDVIARELEVTCKHIEICRMHWEKEHKE